MEVSQIFNYFISNKPKWSNQWSKWSINPGACPGTKAWGGSNIDIMVIGFESTVV